MSQVSNLHHAYVVYGLSLGGSKMHSGSYQIRHKILGIFGFGNEKFVICGHSVCCLYRASDILCGRGAVNFN